MPRGIPNKPKEFIETPTEKVEIVPQRTHCKNCHCPKDQHHGKDREWCNVFGCLCQDFK